MAALAAIVGMAGLAPWRAGLAQGGSSAPFADEGARTLLLRARAARMATASAIRRYDATVVQRATIGLGVRRAGFERQAFRVDHAARVQWERSRGLRIDALGTRTGGFITDEDSAAAGRGAEEVTIPYFPGRETLWFPAPNLEVARGQADAELFVHPLAAGAEAHYRYATGDSASIRLPVGARIGLRELRIVARRRDWRVSVGSFWFDTASAQLVRATYRLSAPIDIWPLVSRLEGRWRDSLTALRDSAADALVRQQSAERLAAREEVPGWTRGLLQPLEVTVDAVTVEYGLHAGRFWLPRAHSAEGRARATFLTARVRVDEQFRYASVDGDAPLDVPPVGAADSLLPSQLPKPVRLAPDAADGAQPHWRFVHTPEETAATVARLDSMARAHDARGDTTGARQLRAHAMRQRQLDERVRAECATDSMFTMVTMRFDGTMRTVSRRPCTTRQMARALPDSAVAALDAPSVDEARDGLLEPLGLGLQPGWTPEWPRVDSPVALWRYNRIEGLSGAIRATSALGGGMRGVGVLRLGAVDRKLNAELQVDRGTGRTLLAARVSDRLRAANEEFGSPLAFGPSLAALLYGRDDGFYFRSREVELSAATQRGFGAVGGGTAQRSIALFAEQHRSAGDAADVIRTWSLARAVRPSARFAPNITADRVELVGVRLAADRTFGSDAERWRSTAGLRLEGATGSTSYARAIGDLATGAPIGWLRWSTSLLAGHSAGTVPEQRRFFLGGTRTVRGQRPGIQRGDAFWLIRSELGARSTTLRPVVFADLGWAGARTAFGRSANGRATARGVGVGVSALDGIVRADLARGIAPERRWRFDLYLDARL